MICNNLLGDLAPLAPATPWPPALLAAAEDQGGEIGDLGEDECDPGEVILICAQLLARLSSEGVLSTVILGIRPSMERDRTPIPTGEGERDRRRPEKLVPLCKTSMSKALSSKQITWDPTLL